MENNELIEIKEITHNSEEYKRELDLRDDVLRKPLGMSIYNDNLEKENADAHIGAFKANVLVGVLVLTKYDNLTLKMRQVAVDEKMRSMKIGSQMVQYAEQYALKYNYTFMVLNARSTAVEFYEKLGYTKISEMFLEINIPHYKMQKNF